MSTTLTRVAAATAVAATLALATPTGAMAAPADTQGSGDELVHMLTTGTSTIFETNGRWVLVGGDGSSLPELGACNPRYANEIARKLILNRPEGFSDAHDVPHHILEGVFCGAVTDEEVLAFLCEPREWSTEYAGEPEYAGGSWSEWTTDDARKLRERLGR